MVPAIDEKTGCKLAEEKSQFQNTGIIFEEKVGKIWSSEDCRYG